MNILHLRASNFYGGPERQLHFHARHSDSSITIASYYENSEEPSLLKVAAADNIKTHCFRVNSAYDSQTAKILKKYFIENDIDIVCTHD